MRFLFGSLAWGWLLGTAVALTFTIDDTNYTIPAGAYYVDATNGNDSRTSGQAQVISTPWLTINKAVTTVATGSTIVIRAGTYRESTSWCGKVLTLQPYPHEQVWMKGSDVVTGWVVDGSAWRKDGWTTEFIPAVDTNTIDPAFPLAGKPDQVFVDSDPLTQVATQGAVTTGTFFVNYTTDKLYIGTDPTGKTVEASTRTMAINIACSSDGSVIRGLGFRDYAPHYEPDEGGMVRSNSGGNTFEHNVFAYSACRGLSLIGTGPIVQDNQAVYNGEGGMGGFQVHNAIVERNYIAHNNTEHFALDWDANGLKFFQADNIIIRDNVLEDNLGGGLWCDWTCHGAIIVRNITRNNPGGPGIFYEKSATGIIAANVVTGNRDGIMLSGTNDTQVYNNTLVSNMRDFFIIDDSRRTGDGTSPGVSAGNTLYNNLLSNNDGSSTPLVTVEDFTNGQTGDQMVTANDYNGFYRTSSTTPTNVFGWEPGTGAALTFYASLAAYVTAKTPRESHSVAVDNTGTNPFFVDAPSGNYRLKGGSVAVSAGIPVSSTIANAINSGLGTPLVTAGQPVDMGMVFAPAASTPSLLLHLVR